MGHTYSNPDPSPAPSADSANFHWRDDIREYDTMAFRPDTLGFPFFYEDLDLLMMELRHLKTFDMACRPSMMLSVLIVILINLAPIAAYIYWSVVSGGRHLWTLSLVPIYLALNALFPLLINKLQIKVMKGSKEKRADEFKKILADFNEKCFFGKNCRADYSTESFILSIRKR